MKAHRARRAEPTIVHEDAAFLVVDKPTEIPVIRRDANDTTLGDMLVEAGELPPDASRRPMLPIDADATGLTLFARTADVERSLESAAEQGDIEAVTFALVSGIVGADGEIDRAIRFDKRRGRPALVDGGSPAKTTYHVRMRVAGHTLLECTTRTHLDLQLRLHLGEIGHPLAVDPALGGGTSIWLSQYKPGYRPSARHEERPLIARLSLHVGGLRFAHPTDGTALEFTSPLPKDMRATVNQLERLL